MKKVKSTLSVGKRIILLSLCMTMFSVAGFSQGAKGKKVKGAPVFLQVVYQGKRTINMDSKGTVYLSKTMSIELGILGGGRVNFAHDEDTGEWYICHTTDKDGFTVWKDKRCARFSAGFIVRRIMLQAKVERKTVQFMIAKAPIEVGGTVYYKILLSNPIFK